MLTQEDYWMIQELHQQGVYRGDFAERESSHPTGDGCKGTRGKPSTVKVSFGPFPQPTPVVVRLADLRLTDLRLALGPVMATFAIGLFAPASCPAVTSNACGIGDRLTHWPGFLGRNHSRNATFRSQPHVLVLPIFAHIFVICV